MDEYVSEMMCLATVKGETFTIEDEKGAVIKLGKTYKSNFNKEKAANPEFMNFVNDSKYKGKVKFYTKENDSIYFTMFARVDNKRIKQFLLLSEWQELQREYEVSSKPIPNSLRVYQKRVKYDPENLVSPYVKESPKNVEISGSGVAASHKSLVCIIENFEAKLSQQKELFMFEINALNRKIQMLEKLIENTKKSSE